MPEPIIFNGNPLPPRDRGAIIGGVASDDTSINVGSIGSTLTLTAGTGRFYGTLTSARCAFALPSGYGSSTFLEFNLYLAQDSTGGRIFTFPSNVSWIKNAFPYIDLRAGATTVMTLRSLDGGATWIGSTEQAVLRGRDPVLTPGVVGAVELAYVSNADGNVANATSIAGRVSGGRPLTYTGSSTATLVSSNSRRADLDGIRSLNMATGQSRQARMSPSSGNLLTRSTGWMYGAAIRANAAWVSDGAKDGMVLGTDGSVSGQQLGLGRYGGLFMQTAIGFTNYAPSSGTDYVITIVDGNWHVLVVNTSPTGSSSDVYLDNGLGQVDKGYGSPILVSNVTAGTAGQVGVDLQFVQPGGPGDASNFREVGFDLAAVAAFNGSFTSQDAIQFGAWLGAQCGLAI